MSYEYERIIDNFPGATFTEMMAFAAKYEDVLCDVAEDASVPKHHEIAAALVRTAVEIAHDRDAASLAKTAKAKAA